MRILNRNKQTVYYAIYNGITPVVDEDGFLTGEKAVSYGAVTPLECNVSAARGTSDLEMFGINEVYTRTLATDQMNLGITESSIVWEGLGIIPTYDEETEYTTGDIVIKDDKIQKYNGIGWEEVPHNYVVVSIAKSINSVTYAIKKVDVT